MNRFVDQECSVYGKLPSFPAATTTTSWWPRTQTRRALQLHQDPDQKDQKNIDTVGLLWNPNHQLINRWFIPLLIGFQPSFWWCRISQPSTVWRGRRLMGSRCASTVPLLLLRGCMTGRQKGPACAGVRMTNHWFISIHMQVSLIQHEVSLIYPFIMWYP